MNQIVLILLFIFTLQKKINTDSPKDLPKNQHLQKRHSYRIPSSADCPSGYTKLCFGKGKFQDLCYCFEKKSQKINRILKEVRTT